MSKNCFVWIGGSTHIPLDMILAITNYDEPQAKKVVKEAREKSHLWDISRGKSKKAVVVLKNDSVVVSGVEPQEIIETFKEESE